MRHVFLCCLCLIMLPIAAHAQVAQPMGKIQINNDQLLMLQAPHKVVTGDYKGAEDIYTRVIAMNGSNIEAYLQRGVVRRELGDQAGVQSDGRTVVVMSNNALKADPRNAQLYYQRGMGFRLLRNFDQAEKDIRTAIQLGGSPSWNADIQAIRVEKKVMQ